MSGTIPRRARYLTFSGLATLGLAVLAQFSAGGSVIAADAYAVPLHQAPPITNSGFQDSGGETCPGSPAMWGWHFILTGGEAEFVQLTTTFETAGVIVTNTFGPPDAKHAYVYTATDDTLLAASAMVTGGDPDKVRLVLSHTCAGGQAETPSPTPSAPPTTVPPTTVPPTTVPPTTVPPTTVPPTTVPPTTVPPTTVPPTTVPPTTVPPTETVVPTTPAPVVSGTRLTQTPDVTVSPSVKGVKQTRAAQPPQVGAGRLPNTGNPMPVALLLALGLGLIAAGVVTTVAGEPAPVTASPKHRR
ncbi:MAG TPA: hypothetical protein VNA14_11640 [Mycobacteriales bacterium]|nr:hypothetical protein [Mycobacteriales bacterium]